MNKQQQKIPQPQTPVATPVQPQATASKPAASFRKFPRIGRPSKYKKKYCQMIMDHLDSGYSIESFAAVVHVNQDTIWEWIKVHDDFSEAVKRGRAYCQLYWEKIGMTGMMGRIVGFNPTTWIFNMKNRFNWQDKVETSDPTARKLVDDAEEELKKEDPTATLGRLVGKYARQLVVKSTGNGSTG